MSTIPGKLLHRTAETPEELLPLLSDREFGFCNGDRTAYTKRDGKLVPLWHLPEPQGLSLLVGTKDGENPGTYGWETAEMKQLGTEQTNELLLWSRLSGKGFYAEVAKDDERGRNIATMLDLAGIGVCIYDETSYDEIIEMLDTYSYIYVMVDMESSGKIVYLPMTSYDGSSVKFSDVMDGTDYCNVSISESGWTPVDIEAICPRMTDEDFEDILDLFNE